MIDWVVIVPVKRFMEAKTRFGGSVFDRARIAEALTRDTLAAVAGSERVLMVLVVTDDPEFVDDLQLPVAVTVIVQRSPGLNGAISDAIAHASVNWPDFGQMVLLGDVPSLTTDTLDDVFTVAEEYPLGVVPDTSGKGTVLITGQPGMPLLPVFGVNSAARFLALGHRVLRATDRVRRDVDTPADLEAAQRLGVGVHTAGLLRLPAAP